MPPRSEAAGQFVAAGQAGIFGEYVNSKEGL
jgi:hypothetical protein